MWLRRLLLIGSLLLATLGGAGFLSGLRNTVPVVVAREPIPAHTPLSANLLTIRHVNREALAVTAPTAAQRIEDAVGLVTRMNIGAGEVIRREPWMLDVAPAGLRSDSPSARLPDGMRLVGIRVDIPGAVTGWIAAGDRVDVIYTLRSGGTAQAETIVQGVEVFSVGNRTRQERSGSMAVGSSSSVDVSLLVTPEQAQRLALAKRSGGAIDLSLTPPNPAAEPLLPSHSGPAAQAGGG